MASGTEHSARGATVRLRWVPMLVWTLLACTCPVLLIAAPAVEYLVEPAPAWVVPVERGLPDDVPLEQISDGTYYLLSDSQVRTGHGSRERYRRIASTAINANGLQRIANIEIGFDPSYETLALHSVDIVRDGKRIPKLARATVRVLQRETELERRIYDGSKSANLFLDDVRVGDIVDFAYSVRGINPVFAGRDFGAFALRFSAPVARVHVRLLAPAAGDITIMPRNAAPDPVVSERGGLRSYSWRLDNTLPLVPDTGEPVWHDTTPVVQWSAFADWNAVARWAVPLYAVPKALGPALEHEAVRIEQAHSDPASRLLAALRLAQGDIRYLGFAIGTGSHAPNPPDLVYARRFGDCKDKTLLMLALLDRLGIQARAALVNTGLLRGLHARHSSPGQFDHVIVQARIGDSHYWLDPTRATQNADLEHVAQADFDVALIVDPETRGLTSMKPQVPVVNVRHVRATLDASAGFDKPVPFSVVTTLRGARAEAMRETLASSNREELLKTYANYYASYYPGIAIAAPLAASDDERSNRLTMTETYAISDLAVWSEDEQRFSATIAAPDILDLLRAPASAVRIAPLWMSHPVDVTVVTDVLLPSEWSIKPDTTTVEDPAFLFERTIKPGNQRVMITDRFRSRSDEIPAAETVRYAGNLSRARDSVWYSLYWGDSDEGAVANGWMDRINWTLLAFGMLVGGLWTWIAIRAWQHDPAPIGIASASAPRGLKGWLVLPTIGLVLTPILMAFTLHQSSAAWVPETWHALTTFGGASYHALWAPAMLLELVASIGIIVFAILILVLFFQQRTSAPKFYIAFMIAVPAYAIAALLLQSAIPDVTIQASEIGAVVRGGVSSLLWIAYFLRSERVKATFVVRRHAAAALPRVPLGNATPLLG